MVAPRGLKVRGRGQFDTLLWLTARKETQQNKNKRPLCNYSTVKSSQRTLGRIPRQPPPLIIPIPRSSLGKQPPSFDILPFPPIAVATAFRFATQRSAHQRKEVSVFFYHLRVSVTSMGRRSNYQGSGNSGKFKNKDAIPSKIIPT